jgi:hypothetical protein
MAEDVGQEDVVGLVLGFELWQQMAGFQGLSREAKAWEMYLGN